jgi:hypothetical protein
VNELARMRRAFDAIEEPGEETAAAAREALLREIASTESPSPSQPRRRWVVVALAAALLVGGLLVTPAFGIGGRLLELIQGAPRPPEVAGTPAWSPDGRSIAFSSMSHDDVGGYDVYVMNADGAASSAG